MNEFAFVDEDFRFFSQLLKKRAGIALSDHKRQLVYGRLSKRLRELGLDTFSEYRNFLNDSGGQELLFVVNALTTNVTAFYREPHHFRHLAETVLPAYQQAGQGTPGAPLRIWSAGCSSGEEPYTVAMTAVAADRKAAVRILATDIDSDIIARARTGMYTVRGIESLEIDIKRRFFQRGTGSMEGQCRVRPEIRSMVHFQQLNLMDMWPMKNRFHVIFCRNVMIYFDADDRARLADRFAEQLEIGGYLYVGHSESLNGLTARFHAVGQTTYQRVA